MNLSEHEVIASIIDNPDVCMFTAIKGGITHESFTDQRNAIIWNAIETIHNQGDPIDQITILRQISGLDEKAQFDRYMTELLRSLTTSTHCAFHVRETKRLERQRRTQNVLTDVLSGIKDSNESDQKIADCISSLMQINLSSDIPIHKLCDIRQEKIDQWRKAEKTGTVGIPFCIRSVNQYLGGWRERCFCILAGYRGEGKSTLARQDAYCNASAGRASLVFSLEDPYDIAGATIVGCHGGLNTFHCDIGDSYEGMIDKFDSSWRELQDLPLWIVSSSLKIGDIIAVTELMKMRYDIKIIYIDHIQYITPLILKGHNRNETIAMYSSMLSALAKRLDIPVVALSQLNRSCEQENRKPRLSDLRDSGSLEQDARQILMLMWDVEKQSHVISVAKNNYGISGKEVQVWRLDGKHKFSEIEPERKEQHERE